MSGQQTLSRIGKSANTLFGLHELWDVALKYGTALTSEPVIPVHPQIEHTRAYIDPNIVRDNSSHDQLTTFDNGSEIAFDASGIPIVLGDTLLAPAQGLQFDTNTYGDISYVNQAADTLFNPYTNQYLQHQQSTEALVNSLVDPTLDASAYYPPIPVTPQPRVHKSYSLVQPSEGKRKRKSNEVFSPAEGYSGDGPLESLRLENKLLKEKVFLLEQTVKDLTQRLEAKDEGEGPKKKKRSNRNAVVGQLISTDMKDEADTNTQANGKKKKKNSKEKENEPEIKEEEVEEEEEEKEKEEKVVVTKGKGRKGRRKGAEKEAKPVVKEEKPTRGRPKRRRDDDDEQEKDEQEENDAEEEEKEEKEEAEVDEEEESTEAVEYQNGEYVAVAPESETEPYWIGKVSLIYKKKDHLRVHWLERHPNFKNIFYESTGYDKIPTDTILYSGFEMEQLDEGVKYNFKWPTVPVKLRPGSATEFVPTVLWREPKELLGLVQEAMANLE